MAKPRKPKDRDKPFQEMNSEELRAATSEFDLEFSGDTFGRPNATQRKQLARAKRKRGRPRIGKGCQTISVTVEKQLLAKTDRLAKRLNVARATLIARGLQALVTEELSLGESPAPLSH